jgi:cysteine-rich repeat protein
MCSACTATDCQGCISPYYLANSTSCTYNCTSINGCSSCSVLNSQIACNTCSTNYRLVSPSNCTLICNNIFTFCSQCNLTDCFLCDNPYYLANSTSCSFNCSSINFCSNCSVVNNQIQCDSCITGFQPDSSYNCFPICGDGLVLGNEECDDANTNNGDGCSSRCTL